MDPYRMTDNNNSVSKCYFNFFSGLLDYACYKYIFHRQIYLLSSLIYIQCTAVPALLCIEICTKGCCNFANENYANLLQVA